MRRRACVEGNLARISENSRESEAGGDGRLSLDVFDSLVVGRVDVGRRPGQVAVGRCLGCQLGNHRHAGLVGLPIEPGLLVAVLGDESGIDQAVLRRHLAGRVTGRPGRHAVHVDDDDVVAGALQQHCGRQPADPRADHDHIGGHVATQRRERRCSRFGNPHRGVRGHAPYVPADRAMESTTQATTPTAAPPSRPKRTQSSPA